MIKWLREKQMDLEDLRALLKKTLGARAISIDIEAVKPFPVPKARCISLYVKGVGFVFAVYTGQGITKTRVSEYLQNPQLEREKEDKIIFLLFDADEGTVEIYLRNKVYVIPVDRFSAQALAEPEKYAQTPKRESSELTRENSFKRPYEGIPQVLTYPDRIRLEDVPELSNFSNYLIHSSPSELFNKKIWHDIGLAATHVIPAVFSSKDQRKQDQTLELIARSVPFMTGEETLKVIRSLFEVISSKRELSLSSTDKIASIVLVSSSSVDQAAVRESIKSLVARFDKNAPVSSNLAKLIRKFS